MQLDKVHIRPTPPDTLIKRYEGAYRYYTRRGYKPRAANYLADLRVGRIQREEYQHNLLHKKQAMAVARRRKQLSF